MPRQPMIVRYQDLVPVPGVEKLTMGEGDTPMVRCHRLGGELGIELWCKHEGANPTGSFKDRGMVVAVGRALARGARGVLCASTGNTAASAAAYAARAGLSCTILFPAGRVAAAKLAQALAYGARVIEVSAGFDECLELARELSADGEWDLVNSVNPDRIDGQSTLAFEVSDELGRTPDFVVLPVGNAGNITAIAQGFSRLEGMPRLVGVQAAGAAPLVHGRPVSAPDTIASAIRIGRPASADGARAAVRVSGGRFVSVPDDELVAAGRELARLDGVAAEPASVAAVAGTKFLCEEGYIPEGSTVISVLTGHLLKDPGPFADLNSGPPAKADSKTIRELLGGVSG